MYSQGADARTLKDQHANPFVRLLDQQLTELRPLICRYHRAIAVPQQHDLVPD